MKFDMPLMKNMKLVQNHHLKLFIKDFIIKSDHIFSNDDHDEPRDVQNFSLKLQPNFINGEKNDLQNIIAKIFMTI
jgi:hypothetical protein